MTTAFYIFGAILAVGFIALIIKIAKKGEEL